MMHCQRRSTTIFRSPLPNRQTPWAFTTHHRPSILQPNPQLLKRNSQHQIPTTHIPLSDHPIPHIHYTLILYNQLFHRSPRHNDPTPTMRKPVPANINLRPEIRFFGWIHGLQLYEHVGPENVGIGIDEDVPIHIRFHLPALFHNTEEFIFI